MPGSMYSLMLSDEVIRAVDSRAKALGTNRSALIDRILAEHLALSTPEMRLWDILDEIQAMLQPTPLRFSASSGGTMTLRTALAYKYNPSVQYTVEIADAGPYLGTLRCAVRSQNAGLIGALRVFFHYWARLENALLPGDGAKATAKIADGRMERTLRRPAGELSSAELATAITAYVSLLDGCLKLFFENLDRPDDALQAVENHYRAALPGLGKAASL